MSTCVCDGPPHAYDPSWCGEGKRAGDREPINLDIAAARLELEAAKLRARATYKR